MADAEMQVGNDRVSASEVRVDLREALSDVDPPRPGQPNGQQQQPVRQERPPIWDEQGPRQRHPLPPLDQQPRAQQPFSAPPQAAQAAQAVAEPQPVTEPEDPLSTELLPADIYRIVDGKEVRDTPWTRFVGRAKNVLTSPPARQEQDLDQKLQQLRVRGLSHGVTVALGSIKGGVGKTTLTLALADMLADSLRCGVLVVDADLEWGTAADSTPQDGRRGATLTEVLAAHDQINSPGDLAPYLLALPGGAQLLAGPTDPTEIEQIQSADMQRLLELLRRFFPVILLDLSPGIGLRGTIPRWAFGSSDEIVAIATPTRGSLRRAGRMLGYLAEHRPEVPITLALNMVPRRPDEASRRVIQVAERNGKTRRYCAIPRDDALLRQLDAGLLDIDELDQLTRIAIKDLAFQLADTWCR
jgi:MinD-like ATPase involved in chromosome partitioning or flagellar assembly